MIKSKKTIIYMLVALFVAVSVAFVDVGKCFASSGEGFTSTAWRWFKYDSTSKEYSSISCPDTVADYDGYIGLDYKDLSDYSNYTSLKYKHTIYSVYSEYGETRGQVFTFESSSEIIGVLATRKEFFEKFYFDNRNGLPFDDDYLCLWIVSKSEVPYVFNYNFYSSNKWQLNTSLISGNNYSLKDKSRVTPTADSNGNYYSYYPILLQNSTFAGVSLLDDMKFFDSVDSAYSFIDTGDASGAVNWDNSPKQTYSSDLLLNDFDVQFHDSNKFEECYLDVKYTIPDSLKSVSSFQIDMEERFDWVGTISGSVSDVTDSHTGTNYVDVLNHADGFRIYLKDIKAIDNFINKYDGAFDKALKRFVLGNLNYVNFPFLKYIIGTVKTSNLNIKFHLVAEKKYGHYVDYNLNLLSGVGVKNSYVPDTEGNYTSNNDTKVMGHYYADVGTDAAGNTTYNYYYYYSDGGKEKISAEDATNNTVTSTIEDGAIRIENNPVFNNNITVEGDNIRNEANSYADSKADSSTNKSFIDKFLGFFDIIENNTFLGVFAKVFGWLPVGVSSLITTALGIVVGIRVFKFFK